MSGTRKTLLGIGLAAASLGLFWAASPAFGHERRAGQLYTLEVGFVQEPTFRGFPNAVDIFITRSADGKLINQKTGDRVDLAVEVQLREKQAFDSKILQSAKLDPLTQSDSVPNEYNSWFLPTVVGTYAFHVTGTVSDDSDPVAGPQTFDATFVCGNGSRDTNTNTVFDCVKAAQLFPSGQ